MTACVRIDVVGTQAGGTLTIGGEVMHRTAFAVTQVAPLWPRKELRGADLLIPGAAGVLSLPRRVTARKVTLPMVMDGRFLPDGTDAPSELGGIKATLAWLDANIVAPSTGNSTRVAILTDLDGGDPYVGPITVEGIEPGDKVRGLWRAVIDITIPAGNLVPTP